MVIENYLDNLDKFGQVQKYPSIDRFTFNQILEYVKKADDIICLSPNEKPEKSTDYYYPNFIRHRVVEINQIVNNKQNTISEKDELNLELVKVFTAAIFLWRRLIS